MSRTLHVGMVTGVMVMALSLSNVAHAEEDAPAKVEAPKVEAVKAPVAPVVPVVAPAAPGKNERAPSAPSTTAAITAAPVPVPVPAAVPVPVAAAIPVPVAAAIPVPAALEPSPLPLKQTKPLTLADDASTHTSWGYKAIFGAIVAAGGYIAWKRKKAKSGDAPIKAAVPQVKILSKQSMGLRGEVALIEAGGMRVLVGVTSGSMTTLAVLPDDETEAATDEVFTSTPVRAGGLFASKDLGPPIPARVANFAANRYADDADDPPPAKLESIRPSKAPRARSTDNPPIPELPITTRVSEAPRALEGQARGLALALGRLR